MMFRHTFQRDDIAQRIERAVRFALQKGLRTPDIAGVGERVVGTREMGEAVAAALRSA
jgi:3-isopropylmalate dehydrogenase